MRWGFTGSQWAKEHRRLALHFELFYIPEVGRNIGESVVHGLLIPYWNFWEFLLINWSGIGIGNRDPDRFQQDNFPGTFSQFSDIEGKWDFRVQRLYGYWLYYNFRVVFERKKKSKVEKGSILIIRPILRYLYSSRPTNVHIENLSFAVARSGNCCVE